MPKITIDEVEYDTDNFNETAVQAYNELLMANNIKQQANYQAALADQRMYQLSQIIVDAQTEESDG
jgi:hypothetical protein